MKDNNKHLINNKFIFWGICVILLLPVIVLPPTFQPSDWTRTILLRTILTILISFVLFKFFYKKECDIYLPKWDFYSFLPLMALLAFFGIQILATIFSQDLKFSIFGSPARAGGLLSWAFYLIFAVFIAIFINEQDWQKLWKVNFIAGILASLLAFVQYFGLLSGIFISHEGGNTPSLLGNSTFLATYMIFLSFLSLTFLMKETDKRKRLFYAGLFCLFIFTILISGSRASYIAFLAGLLYFFLFYPGISGLVKISKKLRHARNIAVVLSVLAVLFVIYANISPKLPNFIEKDTRLSYLVHNRLSVKTVLRDISGTRFETWKIALKEIQDKPLLGWGPENFYIGFEKYYDPNMPDIRGLWIDRPHNILLDVAANSGVIALLLYFAFWITLFWRLQVLKKEQENNKYSAHGLQAMFLGYLIILFFNFDNFSTYLISFFFIGYSFYLIFKDRDKIVISPPAKKIFQSKAVVVSSVLILACFIWFWNMKPFYINEKVYYATLLSNSQKCNQALSLTDNENWQNTGILQSYAPLKYADLVKKCAPEEKSAEYSKKALEGLKVASAYQPYYTRTWLFMGSFANILAVSAENQAEQEKLLQEAKGYLEKALKISPRRQEITVEMQKSYLLTKDYTAMEKLMEGCIKIDSENKECYWYLGISQIFLGDQENGKKNIEVSKEKGYGRPPYIQLAVAYISQKNYEDAAKAYEQLIFYYPQNASYHATLALLYKKIGEYEEAGKQAVEVLRLQPDNKEALTFAKGLIGFSPNSTELHYSLAYIYEQVGDSEKAKQEYIVLKSIYLQLISQNYYHSEYHLQLAGVYKKLTDYENANREALLTVKISPGMRNSVEKLISEDMPEKYWADYLNSEDYKNYWKSQNK